MLFVFLAACGGPKVRLEKIRFSEQRMPALHANVAATFDKASSDRHVPMVCTLTGPKVDEKSEQDALVPRDLTAMTWHVAFDAPSGGWSEGRYQMTCEAASSTVKGEFQVGGAEPKAAEASVVPHFSLFVKPLIFATEEEYGKERREGDVFDASELKYVGFEVPLPKADGSYSMNGCTIARVPGGVTQFPNTTTQVTPDGKASYVGSAGYGMTGQWLPGVYELSCVSKGLKIESRRFRVTGEAAGDPRVILFGKTFALENVRVEEINFMEFEDEPPPIGRRSYYTVFAGGPRFIGTEVKFGADPTDAARPFPFRCQYYDARGSRIGGDEIDLEIPPHETSYYAWVSWGNRSGRYWQPGSYYVECDTDGALLAARYFQVER